MASVVCFCCVLWCGVVWCDVVWCVGWGVLYHLYGVVGCGMFGVGVLGCVHVLSAPVL